MAVPVWIWITFVFVFGCCIGSFLNVVVYRLPRDKSLVKPPSSCPGCGKYIQFYDNIPLISWLVLGRKCRYCKVSISPRYFIIEFLTGLVFVGFFVLYFLTDLRLGVKPFMGGGWFIYLISIILAASLIAVSAIDLELWVIPMCVCWFVTAVGIIGSGAGVYVIDPAIVRGNLLLPSASAVSGALSVGALIGLVISCALLATGLVKRSYESEEAVEAGEESENEDQINHRLEVCREIVFLLPIVACSLAAFWVSRMNSAINTWWVDFSQVPVTAGVLGSLWGYFIGCGVVWATRIFGTLGFGKEAMGLGDVHLMGAAGAIIGPIFVTVAFFVAPFFGLAWACFQMFFKKTRQIPYGPFLSLGIFTVMILHDRILGYLISMFYQ